MLDIDAFSNALSRGDVSYARTLGVVARDDHRGNVEHYTGEDAVVYPLGPAGAPRYALRVPLDPEEARSWPQRYADLEAADGTIRRYLPRELTILDSSNPREPGLALVYRWAHGVALDRAIHTGMSPARLGALLNRLADVAQALRGSGLAHGDVSPGNLIIGDDGAVTLIDLDRMGPVSDGVAPRRRPGYRLPDGPGGADAEDAFALLVLMTSVAAISGLTAWERDDDPERGSHPPLLFSSWDLMDPSRSDIVARLQGELSGVPALLLEYLVGACAASPHQVPDVLDAAINDVRRSRRQSYAQHQEQPAAPSYEDTWRRRIDAAPVSDDLWDNDWMETTWRSGSWEDRRPAGPVAPPPDAGELIRRITEAAGFEQPADASRTRQRQRREVRRETVGRELREALARNDREVLVRLAMSGDIAQLGESSRSDLVKVLRALSYDQIARAVASDRDTAIVAAVDPEIFPDDADLDEVFRDRVRLARQREAWGHQAIKAVHSRDGDRSGALVAAAPAGAMDRLTSSVRARLLRLAEIAAVAAETNEACDRRDLGGIVGSMSRLCAITGEWAAHVDADALIGMVGYPRIRQRVIDQLASGSLGVGDRWLVDCVVAAGELDEVLRGAGRSHEELEGALAGAGGRTL